MSNSTDASSQDLRTRADISFLDKMAVKIRRRETPFYDWVYRFGKSLRHIEMPAFRPLYKLLYMERVIRHNAWNNVWRVLYYEPLFKSRCERVGKRLAVWGGGIPVVMGHLRIQLGDNVTIASVTTFTGSKVADDPVLEIGDGSYIGYQTVITVGPRVSIGKHCMIANRVFLAGADNHHVDPVKRRTEPEPKSAMRPIIIEDDVFVATGSTVHKGVTIGYGSIVSAGSVVTRNVPPYTVVAGNPARVVYRIPRSAAPDKPRA